ncbi:MAG: helix-turn-helix domain-containing protein [Clostridia bacterium]|nr:helix-turn-helix domain-containing protein [Clostridia bacterium]
MDNINAVLSENIRKFRKQSGLTQEELADRLGITFQAISKWETGLCAPDILLLPDLADIFGCTIDDLFSRIHADSEPVLPWNDDGTVRGAIFIGKKLLSAEETAGRFTLYVTDLPYNDGRTVNINGECDVAVEGDVAGGCSANGALTVSGDVGGGCSANGTLSVSGDVGGGCSANGNIEVKGDVMGNCESTGSITVKGDIMGSCFAGGGINRG